MTKQYLVPFHGNHINVFEHDSQPFVALKDLCNQLGIDSRAQRNKIKSDLDTWGGVIISIPSTGGVQKTLAIPMTNLFAWLMTISVARVKHDYQSKLRLYQKECHKALEAYWTGQIHQPTPPPTKEEVLIFSSAELLDDFNAYLRSKYPLALECRRYFNMGLYVKEVAKLLDLTLGQARKYRDILRACGFLDNRASELNDVKNLKFLASNKSGGSNEN